MRDESKSQCLQFFFKVNNSQRCPNQSMFNSKSTRSTVKIFNLPCWSKSSQNSHKRHNQRRESCSQTLDLYGQNSVNTPAVNPSQSAPKILVPSPRNSASKNWAFPCQSKSKCQVKLGQRLPKQKVDAENQKSKCPSSLRMCELRLLASDLYEPITRGERWCVELMWYPNEVTFMCIYMRLWWPNYDFRPTCTLWNCGFFIKNNIFPWPN